MDPLQLETCTPAGAAGQSAGLDLKSGMPRDARSMGLQNQSVPTAKAFEAKQAMGVDPSSALGTSRARGGVDMTQEQIENRGAGTGASAAAGGRGPGATRGGTQVKSGTAEKHPDAQGSRAEIRQEFETEPGSAKTGP